MWRPVGLVVLVLVAAGCGGRVEGGSKEPAEHDPVSEPSSMPGGTTDPLQADTELGECQLGPLEAHDFSGACAWVADERCYTTREMACNCVCPRSRDSLCLSNFGDDSPNGHELVTCD